MGTRVQTVKTYLSSARPANNKWIFVAPLPFNRSEISWDQILTPRSCLEQFPACCRYEHASFLRLVTLVIRGYTSPLQKRSLGPSPIQSTTLFKNYSLWSFLIDLEIKRGFYSLFTSIPSSHLQTQTHSMLCSKRVAHTSFNKQTGKRYQWSCQRNSRWQLKFEVSLHQKVNP